MESEVLKETNGLTRVHEVLNSPDVSVPESTLHFYKPKNYQSKLEIPSSELARSTKV